jgi:hypothetical protein
MNLLVITYLIYLTVSGGFTIWVGLTLSRNGKLFLANVFGGDEQVADAVNHLLVVGFYLVNLGFVTWFLRTKSTLSRASDVFNVLSVKIGTVLLVLGVLHLINVWIFTKLRRGRTQRWSAPGPNQLPGYPPNGPQPVPGGFYGPAQ